MEELYKIRDELNAISPTFCVAKWKQVTIHLESGLTHSCHHPGVHKIPLTNLDSNPSVLHNTPYKKRMRKEMLEGKVVKECGYCNKIDQNSKHTFSDRIYKSKEGWAYKYIPEILEKGWEYDPSPSYLEVSFSKECNCQCIYCSASFSSRWLKDIEKNGAYPTSVFNRDIIENEQVEFEKKDNPYIKAFWKWFPDIYDSLEFFRITGGEPLLEEDTFNVLDFLIENPKKENNIGINSNLCVNDKLFDRFIDKMKLLSNKKKDRKKLVLYTSCEASNKKANYIRPGLYYEKWLRNCRKFLEEVEHVKLSFMCTYNLLSITSFKDFLNDILSLKKQFPLKIHLDVPYLLNPPYLYGGIITKDFLPYIEESVTFMYKNLDIPEWEFMSGNGFYRFEAQKMKRVYEIIKHRPEDEYVINLRKDFIKFIDEWDKRRNTLFIQTFPEYTKFYDYCKGLK